jgi:hypothetical protein
MSIHEVKTPKGSAWEVRWREVAWGVIAGRTNRRTGATSSYHPKRNRSMRVHHPAQAVYVDREVARNLERHRHWSETNHWNNMQRVRFDMARFRARETGEPVRTRNGDILTEPPYIDPGDHPEPTRKVAKAAAVKWHELFDPPADLADDPKVREACDAYAEASNDFDADRLELYRTDREAWEAELDATGDRLADAIKAKSAAIDAARKAAA